MKRLIASAVCLFVFIASLRPEFVHASETDTSTTATILGDLDEPASYSQKLSLLLNDSSISEVIVIDQNDFLSNQTMRSLLETPDSSLQTASSISPCSGSTYYKYRITNVANGNDYTGTTKIATATGTPGITISISKTKEVSRTYSTTVSAVTASQISTAVGYSVTDSDSITISGSYTVPAQNNNMTVKSATLNAYAIYSTKTFTVQRQKVQNVLHYPWADYGSGYSRKPYGVSFKKTFSYE